MAIIESLLDTDFYKFTMGQLAYHRYPGVPVRYRLIVRTRGAALAEVIDEDRLREALDGIRSLRLTADESAYLAAHEIEGRKTFAPDYLSYLEGLRLPPYELRREGSDFHLEFAGTWEEAIYWETPALATVSELYFGALAKRRGWPWRERGRENLEQKVRALKAHPDITFVDFGTRRRFSRPWQEELTARLIEALPSQLIGTSNVSIAKAYGIRPVGTFAHELFMAVAGVMHPRDADIRKSHRRVLDDWWDEYGSGLAIALTDTYGSDFFFRDMTDAAAQNWRGLRQDSGDPIAFGEKAIAFYRARGIDPRDKILLFSDGLDVRSMIDISRHFAGRIRVSFGWGTNLTNDVGLEPISMVIKLVEAAGHPTVKLSDNLAKATGDPGAVERFKRIFGYTAQFKEECRY